jgi:hypothetical protein
LESSALHDRRRPVPAEPTGRRRVMER